MDLSKPKKKIALHPETSLALNYIQVACPELDLSKQGYLDMHQTTGRAIKEWVIVKNTIRKDCMSICAPMLGVPQRIMVIDSPAFGMWKIVGNLFITGQRGEAYEYLATLLTHPGKYIRSQVHPIIEVSFDDLETGKEVQWEIEGYEARVWSIMCDVLDGKKLNTVDRDFRTIRKDPGPGPNDPCPCRSGKKFKKCCLRK